MKISVNWLKEYVDIDVSTEVLVEKLFSCGLEVESVDNFPANTKNVVFCRILSIDKHPDADKLSVTKVDAGKYGELQIVTNAKNISVNDIVPVAVDGAVLSDGSVIKKGNLRGVLSEGMFCGGAEMGIDDNFYKGASENTVLIFREEYEPGADVIDTLNIKDVILDVSITANRPDCQSVLGIAREVSAVLNKPFKMPDLSYNVEKFKTTDAVVIENNAPDLCPRYMGHYVKDVVIKESPDWLKKRLASVGIRSINNVVDITNFVLTEIGQPMHAFDLSELGGKRIVIRRSKNGEKIVTLDGKEFTLNDSNLVICDENKPVALAGIMGGLNSGIKENTSEILFESAKFMRDNIRRTSRQLGQKSDSSSRYEKGVDLGSPEVGLKRALNLISTLQCGKIACDEYDLCYQEKSERVINTKISKINGVLGIEVPTDIIKDVLERLFFKVSINGDYISVVVPSFREDVEGYQDLAEEVIREYGYDHVIPRLLTTAEITNGGKTEAQSATDELKEKLCYLGFNEILSYSFISEKHYDIFGYDKYSEDYKFIKIKNPLGEDVSVMRTVLLPSMVYTVARNLNRKNLEGRLFELAKIYKPKSLPLEELPNEINVLSLSAFGDGEDFFDMKGVIEEIASKCVGDIEYIPCDIKAMHPTRSAYVIVDGEKIGYFGELNAVVAEKVGIDKRVYVAEIDYDKLFAKTIGSVLKYKQISKFPTVERDLALVADDFVAYADIVKSIKKSGGEFLESVKLFDVYKGEQIGVGKKSVAVNLVFSSLERTLNVEEIDKTISKILKDLEYRLKVVLR